MQVSRIGVDLELQLPAYATATATPDLSHICNLYHSLQQCWIVNLLNEARDQTHILTLVGFLTQWATMEFHKWTNEPTVIENMSYLFLKQLPKGSVKKHFREFPLWRSG